MPKGVYERTEYHRKINSEGHKGIKQSKEVIENRVKKNTGQKRTEETKKRMSDSQKGKIKSEEHRSKISKTLTGHITPEEVRKKLRIPCKEEAKKKISEALKGEKSYIWKGEDVGYNALHVWITRWKGKPHYCEHCGRTDLPHRSYHWANKSGEYNRNLDDWLRLCVSCHKKYDKLQKENGIINRINNK